MPWGPGLAETMSVERHAVYEETVGDQLLATSPGTGLAPPAAPALHQWMADQGARRAGVSCHR